MGRLSTFAKNRILNLRFQKSFRIKQIAQSLQQDDDIKVSRKSISTFLKKYIETKSINDKPRSGRNKKLTPEEINLIGEITRLNRDITAPKIKEYLNLNVSTYTILRASKLFEWNKLNPNSNEAKKAAALKRQLDGQIQKRRKALPISRSNAKSSLYGELDLTPEELIKSDLIMNNNNSSNCSSSSSIDEDELINQVKLDHEESDDLKLLSEHEIINAKNASSSAMVFATKILYKIFHISELLGHNVSGKTFNRYIKNKKALDQKRISYIKWLVENYFDGNKEEIWKSCRTAINKSIRNSEIKGGMVGEDDFKENKNLLNVISESNEPSSYNLVDLNSNIINESICPSSLSNSSMNHMCHPDQQHHHHQQQQNHSTSGLLNLEPNMSIFQMSNELPSLDLVLNKIPASSDDNNMTSVVTLTDPSDLVGQFIQDENKSYLSLKNSFKKDCMEERPGCDMSSVRNLNILPEHKIIELKSLYCSPMIFATKVLLRIFTKAELLGHNIAGKSPVRSNFGLVNKNQKSKQPLDETRLNYIQWLVRTYFNYFDDEKQEAVWKSCRKAIQRVIRNIEIKESKLIKSCDDNENNSRHHICSTNKDVQRFEDLSVMIEFNNDNGL